MDLRDPVDQLLHDYRRRRLSRRAFMTRALALGLSMPTIGGLLAGAAEAAPGAPATRRSPLAQQPKTGGTLKEGYDRDFSRMDPVNTNWYDPGFYALYDTLLTNDPDGKFVPMLAESWQVAPDGKSVTFKIRGGVKFHTGRPLNAAAIKEVFDAIKDPKSGSPLASLFVPVTSIAAPDEVTLVLNMAHPYYDILNVVKTGFWAIVNMQKRTELGAEYGKQVIDGSGPFTFVEWATGDHVSVKRWEDYPGSIVPYFKNKGKAYLDGVRWEAIMEAEQRAIRLENNEIDALHGPAFQDVARLEQNSDLNVIKLKEWSGYILSLNVERTDFDFQDVKMRQAISHAIDRQAMVKGLLFGQGEPIYGPITSADKYYTKDVEQYNQFDLDKAKALVKELGWTPGSDGILTKNGKRMAFSLLMDASSSFNTQLGSVIQAQLKDLGMDVKVESKDLATYFDQLRKGMDAAVFFYLWPVPIDVFILFVGKASIPFPNWSRGVVQEVEDAIAAWQNAATEDELKAAGAKFQLAVASNVPSIPLINRNNVWVHNKKVHDWLPHQWNLYPYYNDVWME